jgi:hypothetical protein
MENRSGGPSGGPSHGYTGYDSDINRGESEFTQSVNNDLIVFPSIIRSDIKVVPEAHSPQPVPERVEESKVEVKPVDPFETKMNELCSAGLLSEPEVAFALEKHREEDKRMKQVEQAYARNND